MIRVIFMLDKHFNYLQSNYIYTECTYFHCSWLKLKTMCEGVRSDSKHFIMRDMRGIQNYHTNIVHSLSLIR